MLKTRVLKLAGLIPLALVACCAGCDTQQVAPEVEYSEENVQIIRQATEPEEVAE